MKKTLLISFCLLSLFCISGCSKGKQKEVSEASIKKVISEKYNNNNTNLICDELDNAIAFNYDFSYFATKDKVYKLSKGKMFSNDTNCKEVEIEDLDSEIIGFNQVNQFETKEQVYSYTKPVKKFTHYYYDSNGTKNLYGHNYGDSTYKKLSKVLDNISFYSNYNQLKEADGIVITNDALKVFKIVYENTVEANVENFKFKDIKYVLDGDEKILFIQDNIIKTDKAYYEVKAYKSNKEECEKYADIKCKYEYKLVKDEFLTKNYDFIKFASKYNIIDINNNYYTKSI